MTLKTPHPPNHPALPQILGTNIQAESVRSLKHYAFCVSVVLNTWHQQSAKTGLDVVWSSRLHKSAQVRDGRMQERYPALRFKNDITASCAKQA